MDSSQTQTVKVTASPALGVRKLTRAHLLLNRRAAVREAGRVGLDAIAERLGRQLGVAVTAKARVLEASVLPSRSLSSSSAFAQLELSAVAEPALLEIELPYLVALLARLSGSAPAEAVAFALTRVEEAAFGFLCLSAISALRANPELERLFGPRLVRVHADRAAALAACPERWRWMAVEIALEVAGQVGTARLLLPAQPLQSCLAQLPETAPVEIAPEVLQATLPARLRLGRTHLALEAAEQLGAGDVVLFDGLRLREGRPTGTALLTAAGFELAGELTAEGFRLSSAASTDLPVPPEHEVSMSHVSSTAPGLPSLVVDVEVELTRIRLALSELAMLRPGALLSLHCNAAEPVTLWIGDRAVAKAELVEIEGELGARILHLNP